MAGATNGASCSAIISPRCISWVCRSDCCIQVKYPPSTNAIRLVGNRVSNNTRPLIPSFLSTHLSCIQLSIDLRMRPARVTCAV
ncbi:hypothetical protein D3C85_1284180 [compost metagenome]